MPSVAGAWLNAATLGNGEARRANARAHQCGPFPRTGIALRTHAEARQSHAKQRPSAATHGDVPQWHGMAGRGSTRLRRCEVSPNSAMAERPGSRLWHCIAPRHQARATQDHARRIVARALRTATVHRLGKAPRASVWHRHGVAPRAHATARRCGVCPTHRQSSTRHSPAVRRRSIAARGRPRRPDACIGVATHG